MLITQQIGVVANFRFQHRDHSMILHQICHFQPFVKFQVYKNFSCGPPFAKMPKLSDFSCLGCLRLLCLGTHSKWVSVTSQSPLDRSGFPRSALTTGFLSAFWRSFFGQRNAYNSTNRGRSQFWIAASWSASNFTSNMSLSAICKTSAFQNVFLWSPLC